MDHRIRKLGIAGGVLAVLAVGSVAVATQPPVERPTVTVYKTPT
jgi:hypothetical protein